MKTVILALVGTLIGGGVGTGGGAFLLAQCESDETEQQTADGEPQDGEAVDSLGEPVEQGPDTVGALGPLPDHSAEDAAAPSDEPATQDVGGVVEEAAPSPVVESAAPSPVVESGEDAPPPGAIDPVDPAVDPIVLAPTPDPTALRRLARIFSNMKAEQAAAVMVELTDAEAQRILVSMSERAAAAILGKMDSSRAAVLSQLVMGGGGDA